MSNSSQVLLPTEASAQAGMWRNLTEQKKQQFLFMNDVRIYKNSWVIF
jgi:hypothetical protein